VDALYKMRGENEPALIVLFLPRTPHLFASMEVFVFGLHESWGEMLVLSMKQQERPNVS